MSVDAAWAGVPLISVAGSTPSARLGVTLLNAVGLSDFVRRDLAEYEAQAIALARDPAARAALRLRLVANVATSPLFEVARYAHHLEAAFSAMRQNYVDGRTQDPIVVAAGA
ncbi:MAG: hypothetical protein EXQ91_09035 [Alphaproteobacteria bacterium]|nr:hypothetical protein [Alphaproteobacteria bacterium]